MNWLDVVHGGAAGPSVWLNLLLIGVGMALITKGGDLFTDSAVDVARATRVPPVIIGATIVSMATTFPEFMVSLTGALTGNPGFAVGNALGSCLCNIGLIVGSCGLVKGWLERNHEPEGIPASRVTLKGPGAFMILASLGVWLASLIDNPVPNADYGIARWQGGLLFVVFAAYLAYSLRSALKARYEQMLIVVPEAEMEEEFRRHVGVIVGAFLLGAALVVLGSRILVSNAERLALVLGVPRLIVGLTVLAVGTSLPEYTISLLAVIKGHGSLGIGNIIGANVLNVCWVVAGCALISPLPIRTQTVVLDAPVVLLLGGLLIGLAWPREHISTGSGAVLFGVYVGYLVLMLVLFGSVE